jgi:predicted transcriptional regulator
MPINILLLSIKPEYANKIFEGLKTVELRRVRPRLREDDIVIVYASCPEKALVGWFEVEEIIEEHPNKLWNKVENKAGINRKTFDTYYQGASLGYGIILKRTFPFEQPIDLEIIKQKWSEFRPPQSYHYLKPSELHILESIAECKIADLTEEARLERFYQLALLEH